MVPFSANLKDKVIVITGGSGVLCSEFARALAECGAKLALIGRTKAPLEALCQELRDKGAVCMAVLADVTDAAAMQSAHDEIQKELGLCEILINGAGGNNGSATTDDEMFSPEILENPENKSFFDLPYAAFAGVFDCNLLGAVLTTQIFARDMLTLGKGTILNISSMNAYRPLTKIPAYSAAKSALSNFTQWLAVYFAKSGIRANAIAPGFFSTKQNRDLLWNADGTPTARSGKILRATPMGRFGETEDLIGALLFLCDESCSRFITGITLPVDGGFSAYSGV